MNSLSVRNQASPEVGHPSSAPRFASSREAKEFLIDWIVAEARRLQVPLSEVERKMLYASANGWTLPDMDVVQDAFDRYHEAVEYELKMTNLIRLARADVASGGPEELAAWNEAVRVLGQEDHYLLQMIAASEGPVRRHVSRWKLWLAGLVILGLSIAMVFWINGR
jgi:hypothetical protein